MPSHLKKKKYIRLNEYEVNKNLRQLDTLKSMVHDKIRKVDFQTCYQTLSKSPKILNERTYPKT